MNIEGQAALVTGGASGLGEACVRAFAERGAAVVALDRDAARGEALAAELGRSVRFVAADVTDPDGVRRAIAAAQSLGALRAAVSCAGIGIAQRVVQRDGGPHDLAAFRRIIEVNLIGTFNVMRLCAAAMAGNEPVDGERGVVVNTASIAAFDGQIGQVAYAASKGGVVGMTLPAARDLAKLGVRVMTIAPGLFDTPLLGGLPADVKTQLGAVIPYPSRLGHPREYAALVAHIVDNAYLNGEVIRCDGALRMPPR